MRCLPGASGTVIDNDGSGCALAASEAKLQPILKLKGIRRVSRRIEPEYGVGWKAEIRCTVHGIQVGDVDSVEEIEKVTYHLGTHPIINLEQTGHAQIHCDEIIANERIAAQPAGTIREGVSITIRI